MFDASHNERVDIHDQYSNIRLLLKENGFETEKYEEYPIKASAIKDYSVIVFGGVDGSKFFTHELRELTDYASEGGAILVLSHSGGDSGMGTNMNEMLKDTGIQIERNQVQDPVNCWSGLSSHIEIERFTSRPTHPIISGLQKICYISGCELIVDSPAIGLAFSEGVADPPNACTIAISRYRSGRIGVLGSHRMFSNNRAGIGLYDNSLLFIQLIRWLAGSEDDIITSPVAIPKKMGRTVYYKPSTGKEAIPTTLSQSTAMISPKDSDERLVRPSQIFSAGKRSIRESIRQSSDIISSEDEGERLVRPSQIAQVQPSAIISQSEEGKPVSQDFYIPPQPAVESKPIQRETTKSYRHVIETSPIQEGISETLNLLVKEVQTIGVALSSVNEHLHYIRGALTKLVEDK